MRYYLRIFPQMIVGAFMFFIIIRSMCSRITPTDLIVLPFVSSLFIGGILSLLHKPVANWLLFFGSLGALAAGTFFHYLRIRFIVQNGGMEGANGYGSPLAFLLGWAAATIILFLPGLLFSIWNAQQIIQHLRLQKA